MANDLKNTRRIPLRREPEKNYPYVQHLNGYFTRDTGIFETRLRSSIVERGRGIVFVAAVYGMTKRDTLMKHGYIQILLGIIALGTTAFTAAEDPAFQVAGDKMDIKISGGTLDISLRSPRLLFRGVEGYVGDTVPASVSGDLSAGEPMILTYAPVTVGVSAEVNVRVSLTWMPEEGVLRKKAFVNVLRASAPLFLEEVVLEVLDAQQLTEDPRPAPPRSTPVFLPGFFAGIEFPVAATRIEGKELLVAHCPRVSLETGDEFESRCAVFGVAESGLERAAFHRYIGRHRPAPAGLHFNYNSWWTSPVPFSEQNILDLMAVFEKELYQAHDVALDSFTIDMGWSDPKHVWEIDMGLFPEGFSRIQAAAERMGARLGLWISPSSFYAPAVDPEAARQGGYESFEFAVPWSANPVQLLSLGGERYSTRFRERLVDMVSRFGIRQVKLDGYYFGGTQESGPYSAEATAAGGIAAFETVRAVAPDLWFEGTFDANASPWWLFYLNSVIGGFGDDSPAGRVPCPVYRESYTTARDYYNLQAADRLSSPIAAQEILGIIHQSNDCFMNDAVACILRGNAFISLYVNPKFMNAARWARLAETLRWARNNEAVLVQSPTEPLRPEPWLRDSIPWQSHDAPMPRTPYGYAHWSGNQGLVMLRNPWIAPQAYPVTVPEETAPENAERGWGIVSLYPEPRIYASHRKPGDVVQVMLAPYETVVLSLKPAREARTLPAADACVNQRVDVNVDSLRENRVAYEEGPAALGPDWMDTTGFDAGMLEIALDARIRVDAPRALLLVLAEGKVAPPRLEGVLKVNGSAVQMKPVRSSEGFKATTATPPENWTFLEAELPSGESAVTMTAATDKEVSDVSAWVWTMKPGAGLPDYANALPSPEWVSLSGASLLAPGAFKDHIEEETRSRTLKHIDGVYLDTLDPVSEVQGWGKLQRNQSVWERPMTIAGQQFRRGLGVHAVSEVVYALDRKYRSFEARVGADGANRGTVAFEIWVDGTKKWESGRMTWEDPARPVQVDITGASELRLKILDGGDGNIGDHANWAEACVLR